MHTYVCVCVHVFIMRAYIHTHEPHPNLIFIKITSRLLSYFLSLTNLLIYLNTPVDNELLANDADCRV